MKRVSMAVFALAAASLLLESSLTRLLAVAQSYHFAFLAVSLALLGFGASGTQLSISSRLRSISAPDLLAGCGLGFTLSCGLAYALVNLLPFDSYTIAWQPIQVLYFCLYYLALALPFLFAGLGIGGTLSAGLSKAHRLYAANLAGSAAGALLAPLALSASGVPGALLLSAALGLAILLITPPTHFSPSRLKLAQRTCTGCLAAAGLALVILAVRNLDGRGILGLTLSPYKGLAYARQVPAAQFPYSRWNASRRLDLVSHAALRSLPGLSYACKSSPIEQLGASFDADASQPVPDQSSGELASCLPEALAYQLYPAADVLVLESGGGLAVLQALAGGAAHVSTTQPDRLLLQALAGANIGWSPFDDPRVQVLIGSGRTYLQASDELYDLIIIPLTDAYRPVTSGAYALGENYLLTREAFIQALQHLRPGGSLVITRWLQSPSSESLRLLATLVEALRAGGSTDIPGELAAYRGIQTITAIARPGGWPADDLAKLRQFTRALRYDLVWAPDIRAEEANRYNRLPAAQDYLDVQRLFDLDERENFYKAAAFQVRPATDNQPFFYNFFKWRQTPEVLAAFGRTWAPFGGSGFFVLLAFLALALLLSLGLIIIPLAVRSQPVEAPPPVGTRSAGLRWRVLGYFSLLGFAFLFVEIPLIQRMILLLGNATYAFSAVVGGLLVSAGVGSALSRRAWIPPRATLALLAALAAASPLLTLGLEQAVTGWALPLRAAAVVAGIAPLGVLMGMPFPLGLAWLERSRPELAPWAWAVNGCASVVASVLTAILSLGMGFSFVLWAGAAAYLATAGLLPAQKD